MNAPDRAEAATALVLLDPLAELVARVDEPGPLLDSWRRAIDAAQSTGALVVYVVVAFRPGYPELPAHHHVFGPIAASGRLVETDPERGIHTDVAPAAGDIVVTKRRISAFSGTDLDLILRVGGTTQLVLAGVATSGVVLSTLTDAVDRDYDIVVLEDGCRDFDPILHRTLIERYLPTRATVMTSEVWAESRLGP